jgi:Concanavalin A-like lectin/glucanases superfamily
VVLRPSSARGSALAAGALIGALCGCPQLLDDDFDVAPALPRMNLDSAVDLGHIDSDAGVEPAVGSGGAGASSEPALTGGSGNTPDPSAAGAASEAPDASGVGGASGAGGEPSTLPDAGDPTGSVTELGPLLAHRYRFDGSGSTVSDSVGSAHGTTVGASQASGKLQLSGTDQYANLPNGLVSGFESVTIEAWVNWLATPASDAADWQTIFSFGNNDHGEDSQGQGNTYLYLTAKSGDSDEIRGGYTLTGFNSEVFADGEQALPVSSNSAQGTQVVLVVNGAQGKLSIFINGALEVTSSSGPAIDLSAIRDVNDWLGRSQFASDPEFHGEILDFRIYRVALSAAQVALSFDLGAQAAL